MRRWPENWPLFLGGARAGDEPAWQPPADIYRTRTGWLLKFELAGVRPEDVEVQVAGSRLTVRGARHDCLVEDVSSFYSMEISYSRFERTVELPSDLEKSRLALEFRDGILLVRVLMEGGEL